MVIVVLVFMVATVAVPTAQSFLRAGVNALPFDLAHVTVVVYAGSLALSLALLFGCLAIIYKRVPHRRVPWRATWPGALGATLAIGAIDYAFPVYLTNISTIARFQQHDRVHPDRARLVLRAGADHPQRRDRQRPAAVAASTD